MILDVTGRAATSPEPKKISAAIVLATVVTLAAVIPLSVVVMQARGEDGPAQGTGLVIADAGVTTELSGAVVAPGAQAVLQVVGNDFVAAAWVLYSSAGDEIASGNSVGAPPFTVALRDGELASLTVGLYDLLVTATLPDGTVVERAARFAIDSQ